VRAINRIVHHDSLIVSPDSRLRVVWGQSVTTWWVHLEGPPHAADARTLHPRATAPRPQCRKPRGIWDNCVTALFGLSRVLRTAL